MLPEGYYVQKSEDGSVWMLESAEKVYGPENRMVGNRTVASGPAGPEEVLEWEQIAGLDYECRNTDDEEYKKNALRKLAALFSQPLLPPDPLLDQKGRQIRSVQKRIRG